MSAKNREDFLQEQLLREFIRKAIKVSLGKRQKNVLEENKLRNLVRSLIKETEVPEEVPHSSTGINVLEELLKKIIPILEHAYKGLTSNKEQRQSFRAHTIQAVQNSLAPAKAVNKIDQNKESSSLNELNIDIEDEQNPDMDSPEDEAFIDVDRPGKKQSKPSKEDKESAFTISGRDLTGRNIALKAYETIEKNIVDAYDVLSDEDDRQVFYDYLLTNLKLYFDKFEDEISVEAPQEPTTDEYEQEIGAQGPEEEEILDFDKDF